MQIPMILALCALFISPSVPASAAAGDFRPAVPGRPWSFPADHGKHPDFLTEWWYFTGNLISQDRRDWGFQLTFFRRSMVHTARPASSKWAVRDVWPAHFALTNVHDRLFFHKELISREGPGLVEAAADRLMLRVGKWKAEQEGDVITLKAEADTHGLDLTLTPQKPLALHGEHGYSRKGADPSQASYYYSFTRLKAEGTLTFQGETRRVEGLAWMDHEFGSSILTPDQAGWDWFSFQLDNGEDLMVFRLRRKDGKPGQHFGSLMDKEGNIVGLSGKEMRVSSSGAWKSPDSGAVYPMRWRIEIPHLSLRLSVEPLIEAQEVIATRSTGVTYWEGAASASGERAGKPLKGRGYIELTGYAHSMGGRL